MDYGDVCILFEKNGGNALQIHLGLSYSTTTSSKQKIHLTPRERKEVKKIM